MTGLWTQVEQTAARMQANQRQAVRAALKAGAKPTSLGRDETSGLLVLRVSEQDPAKAWCLIPAACEAQTLAWYQRITQ